MTIYKTVGFEAAHQLDGHPKCGKLHGHSYKAEVWLTGYKLTPPWGFVLDFHEISDYFKQFDHSDKIIKVSCEQMCQDARKHFDSLFKGDNPVITKVRIWETPTSYAEDET